MAFHPICGISPGFPQIHSEIPQNLELISEFKVLNTHTYFDLIYWTPICGKYLLDYFILDFFDNKSFIFYPSYEVLPNIKYKEHNLNSIICYEALNELIIAHNK